MDNVEINVDDDDHKMPAVDDGVQVLGPKKVTFEATSGDNPVTKFRLDNGLCHSCGTQLYVFTLSKSNKVKPLTIPGQVKRGRCLYCYPDNIVPGGDSDEKAKKSSQPDFFGSSDDDEEEEGGTGDAASGEKDGRVTNNDLFGNSDSDDDDEELATS